MCALPFVRLARSDSVPALAPISPRRELGAYEALWLEKGATFKTLADRFALDAEALPSDFVAQQLTEQCAAEVMAKLKKAGVHQFGEIGSASCRERVCQYV